MNDSTESLQSATAPAPYRNDFLREVEAQVEDGEWVNMGF